MNSGGLTNGNREISCWRAKLCFDAAKGAAASPEIASACFRLTRVRARRRTHIYLFLVLLLVLLLLAGAGGAGLTRAN